MRLRRFNRTGSARFEAYIRQLRQERGLDPPIGLLQDDTCTQLIEPPAFVDPQRQFGDRLDLGVYVDQVLAGVDAGLDAGLWEWLTLALFDVVLPPARRASGPMPESARYMPEITNPRRRYRHLLLGPYLLVRAHRNAPEKALAFLAGPPDEPGEIAGQFAGSQVLASSPGVAALATELYVEPGTRRIKRGAASKGPGTARRLARVLRQLELAWDLATMSAAAIRAVLPGEFERFYPTRVRANSASSSGR